MASRNPENNFINGGGGMGEMINSKNWEVTPLGHPKSWHQKLQTLVSIMLESPLSMCIVWGSEYTQIPNDAFNDILDGTKHHPALGNSARDTFSEIWHIVGSLYDKVMNGATATMPDLLLPRQRNGIIEDCYFDFAGSPIRNDDGKVLGILVTLTENSKKTISSTATRADKNDFDSIEDKKRLYETIIKNTPDLIYVFDLNYRFTYANDSLLEMWGLSSENAVGKPMIELGYEPWHAEMHMREIDQVIATKKPIRGVVSFDHAQLGKRFYDYIFTPVFNENGDVESIAGTTRDISDLRSAEDQLKKSEEQFATLADNMENLAWMADDQGWIFWYNARWFEYTGTSPSEMEGWGWTSVHDPALLPEVLEKWKYSIDSGEPFEMVFPIKGADQVFRSFLTRVFPLRDKTGKIIRWIGTNTDISKQKEAEDQFRQMAERMPQKVWTSDAQGNRNYFNQVMVDYTGLQLDDLLGWGWKEVIHPDDWAKTQRLLEYSIKTGEDYENENRLRRKDGKYLWHIVRATAIKEESGKIKMWIGSNTEIHDQIQLAATLEENLREREKRIQTILQHAPDAVISIDEGGIVRSWNSEAEAIFGWSESEAVGITLNETIIPDRYHHGHNTGMTHFLKTGEGPVINRATELTALRKDGSEFPIELKVSTSMINGKYIFIGFVRDISVRKQAEETIKNRTNQLIEAQQLAHIGSWEWDVTSNVIIWSDELYRIYGLTPQEFEANYENYLRYIHPDDRDFVNEQVQNAMVDRKPFKFFHKVLSADGTIRIISSTGKVFTDEKGDIIKMTGTAQDVTEQKKYEEELKGSEERFYKIFDSNPIPMTLSEIQTNKIKYANNLFYNAFGYDKEDVIGRSSEELELIDPEEYKRVVDAIFGYIHESRSIEEVQALSKEDTEELLLKLKQSEQMKGFEILYTKKNGEKFPALVSFEVIRIGTESFTVTSYQDITERKKAEAQLRIQNQQLEKMNSELEQFAYVSSHDMQEPLRKIQTFVSIIQEHEQDNLSKYGKDIFGRIHKAAHRMQILIQDLLDFSSTSTQERKFENVELNNIFDEVKEDLSDEILKKNATVKIIHSVNAFVIRFQFRQLIFNLISNALKFAKEDVLPLITIDCEVGKGAYFGIEQLEQQLEYCHISITDNGIGFREDYKDKIFVVFQRLHTREQYSGTGIGLAIVKKIVDNHNGVIIAKGALGQGAEFHIYIPNTQIV